MRSTNTESDDVLIEFEAIYAIDRRVYHGETISDEERERVRDYLKKVLNDKSTPLSIILWAIFSAKDYT